MPNYAKHVRTTKQSKIPQSEPLTPDQVPNSAGGYTWQITPWQQALRFLILGSAGGTYYIGERKLTADNAQSILACMAEDPDRLVDLIMEVSLAGRAPNNDPALFALALMATHGTPETRASAYAALPKVARIGTHLFHFVGFVNKLRGWGRGLRAAVSRWYTAKSPKVLAEQLVKYQSRDGWSHRDVIRLAHPKPETPSQAHMLKLAVGRVTSDEDVPTWVRQGRLSVKTKKVNDDAAAVIDAWQYLGAVRSMKADMPVAAACSLIKNFHLPREVVPTELLTKPEVWESLLPHMGYTALLRNLATLTRIGLIAPMSDTTRGIMATLTDPEIVAKSRVHPIHILLGLVTYAQGHGLRGSNTWEPETQIVDALDAAFYLAFGNVNPAGTKHLLGLDVSGSMGGEIQPGLSARVGAAAMALITARTEPTWTAMAFCHQFVPFTISPRQRLDDVVKRMTGMPFGGTDCALPMIYATAHKIPVETFVVYTDNETWFGQVHPSVALRKYREVMGIPARLVVCGMAANQFTIADPKDAGMLDVVGFDGATPAIISSFARGEM